MLEIDSRRHTARNCSSSPLSRSAALPPLPLIFSNLISSFLGAFSLSHSSANCCCKICRHSCSFFRRSSVDSSFTVCPFCLLSEFMPAPFLNGNDFIIRQFCHV